MNILYIFILIYCQFDWIVDSFMNKIQKNLYIPMDNKNFISWS